MRRPPAAAILLLLALAPAAPAIEVTTGFLIGPKYDARAIYVRSKGSAAWTKVTAGGYHKSAEGKILGARRGGSATLDLAGATMIRVPLQSGTVNAFTRDGHLDPVLANELSSLISAAERKRLIVELAVFHPAQDQELNGPDFALEGARSVVDWLIAGDHRNVIINFAPDWEQSGWDFDHWVPLHLELLADTSRARFQEKRAGFASPIAFTLGHAAGESSELVEAGDVIELAGAALSMDSRKIERPVLAVGEKECVSEIRRTSGCVVDSPSIAEHILRLFFAKPPSPPVAQ
jgi:hypothetical protein